MKTKVYRSPMFSFYGWVSPFAYCKGETSTVFFTFRAGSESVAIAKGYALALKQGSRCLVMSAGLTGK